MNQIIVESNRIFNTINRGATVLNCYFHGKKLIIWHQIAISIFKVVPLRMYGKEICIFYVIILFATFILKKS